MVFDNELAVAVEDLYPVTSTHMLIIPRRHVSDYFELHQPERNAIERLLHDARGHMAGGCFKLLGVWRVPQTSLFGDSRWG